MSNANEVQVGGDHYRQTGAALQHWDLAVHFKWDPFQYQITKYVMRWKYKHNTPAERLKDLQKAAHFLQKYIEVVGEYDPSAAAPTVPQPAVTPHADAALATLLSNADWQVEGYYGDLTQHYRCRHCGEMVRAPDADAATQMHGSCATPRYVGQD